MTDFTHLHVHSEYSLLDGMTRLDALVAKTKALGMDSVALTDHGVMYGALEFYTKAKAENIKPIIGVEAYVAPRTRQDREGRPDGSAHHLTLLAMDRTGYRNLLKLTTEAHLNGYYYKPRIDKDLLHAVRRGSDRPLRLSVGRSQSQLPQLDTGWRAQGSRLLQRPLPRPLLSGNTGTRPA